MAKMLGFLQVSSPGRGKDGAYITVGSDACSGGCEEADREQTPSLLPRGPACDCTKQASSKLQPSFSRQVTTQSSPTALPSTATQPSPARWLLSLTPSWPAAEGEAGLLWGTSESRRHPPFRKPLMSSFPSPPSWFCHLDDDNYLNPRALLKLLSSYSATWDVYLGKPSLNRPIRASETLPNNETVQTVVVVRGPMGWF